MIIRKICYLVTLLLLFLSCSGVSSHHCSNHLKIVNAFIEYWVLLYLPITPFSIMRSSCCKDIFLYLGCDFIFSMIQRQSSPDKSSKSFGRDMFTFNKTSRISLFIPSWRVKDVVFTVTN